MSQLRGQGEGKGKGKGKGLGQGLGEWEENCEKKILLVQDEIKFQRLPTCHSGVQPGSRRKLIPPKNNAFLKVLNNQRFNLFSPYSNIIAIFFQDLQHDDPDSRC